MEVFPSKHCDFWPQNTQLYQHADPQMGISPGRFDQRLIENLVWSVLGTQEEALETGACRAEAGLVPGRCRQAELRVTAATKQD